jgi:hypothetical protein
MFDTDLPGEDGIKHHRRRKTATLICAMVQARNPD